MPTPIPYRFRFFRAGAVDQVDLDEGALANLAALDQRLWIALACPTKGLELDPRSLDLIDSDHDGRIRPPEILGAIAWVREVFVDLKTFFDGTDEVRLSTLSDETEAGRAIRDGARRILVNLGRPDAETIRLDDVVNTEKVFEQTTLNGDGIVPVDAAGDAATRRIVEDILDVMGAVRDRSGKPGIDKAKADAFFTEVAAHEKWLAEADPPAAVRVLGDATGAALDALVAVRAKVDDYFVRARLAGFDPRLAASEPAADEVAALAGVDLSPRDPKVARLPLARAAAGRPLPLAEAVNPAWEAALAAFARDAVAPLTGAARASLTEAEWGVVQGKLSAYEAWRARRPASAVAALGDARVRELSAGGAATKIAELIALDAALEAECSRIEAVEKAIRLKRDLVRLLRSFVSFSDLYGKKSAIFQVGTLYIDGRTCDLCLRVHDVAKHAALAGLAKAYLLYCECRRKKDAETMSIVAVVTAGSVDNLMVGRNGVFYDHEDDDWDATITKVVENPIDVPSAFWSPYKRFVRAIEEQVAKRAAAADAQSSQALEQHAVTAATADPDPVAPKAAPPKGVDVGTVAAIGVAVGGIATFFSSVLATFLGLGMWMPLGVCALLLAISGPSMLIAWLKLSQRNIGPILDANGWAVNAFARINAPFGSALTRPGTLPPGARRILDDPFAERRPPYKTYAACAGLLLLSALWAVGWLDALLPPGAKAHEVLHRAAPSTAAPAPSASHS